MGPYLEEPSAEASGRIWLSAADFGLLKAIHAREKPGSPELEVRVSSLL